MGPVMYLPKALQCMATVTLRSQRLRNEDGTKDPDDKEVEKCTRTCIQLLHRGHKG